MMVLLFLYLLCVFFFKHKTAYEVRISDWSSDVCSSDLLCAARGNGRGRARSHAGTSQQPRALGRTTLPQPDLRRPAATAALRQGVLEQEGSVGHPALRAPLSRPGRPNLARAAVTGFGKPVPLRKQEPREHGRTSGRER